MKKMILAALFALFGIVVFAQSVKHHDKREKKRELKEVRCPSRP